MVGNSSSHLRPGVSGLSLYVPALRIPLESWCDWTKNQWPKVQAVVGHSFRCPAPDENVYTLAASAVLRLIRSYGVDPERVGYLALGTETSAAWWIARSRRSACRASRGAAKCPR
jgi:hydroxymethylglutaryl-CoA synthase